MPELPEVETMARSLRPHVIGQRLRRVEGSGLSLRQPVDIQALRDLCGQRILALERSGKYLIFKLHNERTILGHLGMSGRYSITPSAAPLEPHTHLRILLESGLELRYIDPRRFGVVLVRGPEQIPELTELGPDPLTEQFTTVYLHRVLTTSARELKTLLLDQALVAGLGNIYVNEALFHARLRPTRRGHTISRAAANRLHENIVTVLTRAVGHGGTTLSDGGYADAAGQTGSNQHYLTVYGRAGIKCTVCRTPIRHMVQAQRSSYFCPKCQR